jgi:hypothetical protein
MAKVLWTQKQDMGPRARMGHAMTYIPRTACGQLSFPIQESTPTVQITLTARSGATEASVQLTIQ